MRNKMTMALHIYLLWLYKHRVQCKNYHTSASKRGTLKMVQLHGVHIIEINQTLADTLCCYAILITILPVDIDAKFLKPLYHVCVRGLGHN